MKVYIGGAIWRTYEPKTWEALLPIIQAHDVELHPEMGDALVERARGISATHFLNSDCDVHLSIDSDIVGFRPVDVLSICRQAETHDIVAGVYVTRGRKVAGEKGRTFPATLLEDGVRVEMANDPTPVPVKWAATGFMAVHRRVFEKLAKDMTLLHPKESWAFYDFYETFHYDAGDIGTIKLSEDYAFCERARQAGFGVHINPAIRLGHVGSYTYRLEDMTTEFPPAQPLVLTRQGQRWRIESTESRPVRRARERRERKALVPRRVGADTEGEL